MSLDVARACLDGFFGLAQSDKQRAEHCCKAHVPCAASAMCVCVRACVRVCVCVCAWHSASMAHDMSGRKCCCGVSFSVSRVSLLLVSFFLLCVSCFPCHVSVFLSTSFPFSTDTVVTQNARMENDGEKTWHKTDNEGTNEKTVKTGTMHGKKI